MSDSVYQDFAEQLRKMLNERTETMETWTTRDGRVLPIKEMDDLHLINTIRYLQRTSEARMGKEALRLLRIATNFDDFEAMSAQITALHLAELSEEQFLSYDTKYRALCDEAAVRKLRFEHAFFVPYNSSLYASFNMDL